jgi:membrane-bound lytic murein transglycosylase D
MFGNWEVALAAYNCGPGNVRKAIRKSGGKTTFWGIYDHLPKETRSYVPQFQAMLYILNHLEEHNLHLEEPSYPMEYEQIRFDKTFHLKTLASLTAICLKDLEKLNPFIKLGKIPESHRSMSVRIPTSKAFFIKDNLAWLGDSLSKTTPILLASSSQPEIGTGSTSTPQGSARLVYKVKSGDALGTIATRHGVTLTQIKQWNNLSSNVIKVGQALIIHANAEPSSSKTIALNSTNSSSSKTYTVRPGDSLWVISQKHQLSIEQIKRLNNLNSTQIKPGQRLIVG